MVFLQLGSIQSQNYRTPEAYIEDFEKNESFVKESLIEYSSSIIYDYKDSRIQTTLETIYKKLETINTIIINNDHGYRGDVSLRDAFLKMNSRTIALLKDNSLRLNDYDCISSLSFPEIFSTFETRKQEIINYYSLILDYTTCKRNFSKRNNLKTVRYFNKKNLFEYDAHQSLMFFKLNVLDAKLCELLWTNDYKNVSKCVFYLNQVCEESLDETEKYKKVYIDQSLNNANIEFAIFLKEQNETLIPLYKDYTQALSDFKNLKDDLNTNKNVSIENYNDKVRYLNATKNAFIDTFVTIQNQKKEYLEKWYKIKRNFLKNNL